MCAAFILSFAANIVLALVSLVILPEKVAIHFGPGGMANGWAPTYVHTLIFVGLDTVLFCSLYFSPRLTTLMSPRWVNLPHKEYWLAPANKPQTMAKIASLMHQFGTALFLFLFAVSLLTVRANLAQPVRLDERLFFAALILFLLYTGFWC